MATLNIYSIKDIKTCTFGIPIFMPHVQVAIRAFAQLVNDEKSTVFHNPEDFELWAVGEWDDISCTFEQKEDAKLISNAVSQKKTQQQDLVEQINNPGGKPNGK